MYFPYLHGKQKEVLALRHLAPLLGAEGRVQPVIEPVRQAATSVRHTLEACEAHRLQTWLVVNPARQDFELLPQMQTLEWGRQLFTSLPRRQWIHPTLLLGPTLTPEVVRRFVQLFSGRPLGVVVGCDGPPLAEVLALLAGAPLRLVFFKNVEPRPLSVFPAGLSSALGAPGASGVAGVSAVWVEDRPAPDNQALRLHERHLFSEQPLRYEAQGRAGFSDFATLPSRPDAPDVSSRLVSFRLTYLRCAATTGPGRSEVWIEHFIGDRPPGEDGHAQARFRGALQAFHLALDRPDTCFGPTEAARRYLTSFIDGVLPSRALSKQWEVMHHLELMSGMLAGRFPSPPERADVPRSLLETDVRAR
ncbi:hypothetical protein ACNI65_19130 [Roseateles sp. So40a]|uniref:hypothetical protein n=1 Tax=Roseateles sp. So40a TaxID=3400226 RepID=UPI003A86D813